MSRTMMSIEKDDSNFVKIKEMVAANTEAVAFLMRYYRIQNQPFLSLDKETNTDVWRVWWLCQLANLHLTLQAIQDYLDDRTDFSGCLSRWEGEWVFPLIDYQLGDVLGQPANNLCFSIENLLNAIKLFLASLYGWIPGTVIEGSMDISTTIPLSICRLLIHSFLIVWRLVVNIIVMPFFMLFGGLNLAAIGLIALYANAILPTLEPHDCDSTSKHSTQSILYEAACKAANSIKEEKRSGPRNRKGFFSLLYEGMTNIFTEELDQEDASMSCCCS